jgi:hypothetical protein
MKAVAARVIKKAGFRPVLVLNALVSAVFIAACAAFPLGMPFPIIIAILMTGGFFRSLQFTSINAIAYAEVPPERMSKATSLAAVGQQMGLATGVAVGAFAVEMAVQVTGASEITAIHFTGAFLAIAAISAASAMVFARLPADAGAEMADRTPAPNQSSDDKVG